MAAGGSTLCAGTGGGVGMAVGATELTGSTTGSSGNVMSVVASGYTNSCAPSGIAL